MYYDTEFDIHIKLSSWAKEDDALREQILIMYKSDWFVKELPRGILKFFHGTTTSASSEFVSNSLHFKPDVSADIEESRNRIKRLEDDLLAEKRKLEGLEKLQSGR